MKLADRPVGSFLVTRVDLRDWHEKAPCVYAQLRLDTEAFGGDGEGFDESSGHYPIASQQIQYFQSKHHHSKARQKPIADHVTGSICAAANRNSPAGNHIESIVHERQDERRCSRRVIRSEEHTSELQSPDHLVCRLLLEKKKKKKQKSQR